jgi:hypothetical protein
VVASPLRRSRWPQRHCPTVSTIAVTASRPSGLRASLVVCAASTVRLRSRRGAFSSALACHC